MVFSNEMNEDKLNQILTENQNLKLDDFPTLLPYMFRKNFILKHGNNLIGLRGRG